MDLTHSSSIGLATASGRGLGSILWPSGSNPGPDGASRASINEVSGTTYQVGVPSCCGY